MFFRHLHAVARHTPLHIIVTPNGEQLRLIVTPKPSGDAADNPALAKPFTAVGTPEELDAELPEVLRKYTESVNDLRARLDLPLDALEEAKKKAAKKADKKAEKERQAAEEKKRREEAAKKAAETRATNAAKAKAEKEAKDKARAEARAAKKAQKSGGGIKLPGAVAPSAAAPAWPFPLDAGAVDRASAEGTHRADLPGKAECISDYRAMKLKHGDALTRRVFIKKSETGRRYEKLWKNWEAFLKDASAQAELPLEQPTARAAESAPAAAAATSGESPDARFITNNGPAADATPQQGSAVEGTEAAASDAGANEGSNPSGSATDCAPAPDVEPKSSSSGSQDDPAPVAQPPSSNGDGQRPSTGSSEGPKFAVYAEDTGELVAEYRWPPIVGEKLTVNGFATPFRVTEVTGHRVAARRLLAMRKMLLDEAGNPLGSSDEIYELTDQVAELAEKEWRVIREEETAYIVKAAKPRIKGPAATSAAPATHGVTR